LAGIDYSTNEVFVKIESLSISSCAGVIESWQFSANQDRNKVCNDHHNVVDQDVKGLKKGLLWGHLHSHNWGLNSWPLAHSSTLANACATLDRLLRPGALTSADSLLREFLSDHISKSQIPVGDVEVCCLLFLESINNGSTKMFRA
jgi:hypothetical protein